MKKFFWILFWRHYRVLKPLGIALVAIGTGLTIVGINVYFTCFPVLTGLVCLIFYAAAFLDTEAARHLKGCQGENMKNLCLPFFYTGHQN